MLAYRWGTQRHSNVWRECWKVNRRSCKVLRRHQVHRNIYQCKKINKQNKWVIAGTLLWYVFSWHQTCNIRGHCTKSGKSSLNWNVRSFRYYFCSYYWKMMKNPINVLSPLTLSPSSILQDLSISVGYTGTDSFTLRQHSPSAIERVPLSGVVRRVPFFWRSWECHPPAWLREYHSTGVVERVPSHWRN